MRMREGTGKGPLFAVRRSSCRSKRTGENTPRSCEDCRSPPTEKNKTFRGWVLNVKCSRSQQLLRAVYGKPPERGTKQPCHAMPCCDKQQSATSIRCLSRGGSLRVNITCHPKVLRRSKSTTPSSWRSRKDLENARRTRSRRHKR